jgi:hypothetical protein
MFKKRHYLPNKLVRGYLLFEFCFLNMIVFVNYTNLLTISCLQNVRCVPVPLTHVRMVEPASTMVMANIDATVQWDCMEKLANTAVRMHDFSLLQNAWKRKEFRLTGSSYKSRVFTVSRQIRFAVKEDVNGKTFFSFENLFTSSVRLGYNQTFVA